MNLTHFPLSTVLCIIYLNYRTFHHTFTLLRTESYLVNLQISSVFSPLFAACAVVTLRSHFVLVRHSGITAEASSTVKPVLPQQEGGNRSRPGRKAWQREGGERDPVRC